eukprot:7409212-Pyramimonas_sp.AAC.1
MKHTTYRDKLGDPIRAQDCPNVGMNYTWKRGSHINWSSACSTGATDNAAEKQRRVYFSTALNKLPPSMEATRCTRHSITSNL